MWLEIDLAPAGDEVRVSARGSDEQRIAVRSLDPKHDVKAIAQFAAAVRAAAERGRPLSAPILEEAQALYSAVLSKHIDPLRASLAARAGGPLLLRLGLDAPELQAVPWEALCKPDESMGFWASSPDLLPVRSVTSSEPWKPREVSGALRVLAIAPMGGESLKLLRSALAERIEAGEVEWLDPIEGEATRLPGLFDRLRHEPIPHVLHFLGHGGLENGVPVLRLADDEDGEERWLPVELLAQQLKASLREVLRLIVLEACEGARPSAFASAAEILARSGADAVVAHLWPVKADVARAFSTQLYRSLAGADRSAGDIAIGVNEARRAILGAFAGSAEAFSPVVYLRGPDGVLFDFKGRTLPGSGSGRWKAAAAAAMLAVSVAAVGWALRLRGGDPDHPPTKGTASASSSIEPAPSAPALTSALTTSASSATAPAPRPTLPRKSAPSASASSSGAPVTKCAPGTLRAEFPNDPICANACQTPSPDQSAGYKGRLGWIVYVDNQKVCSCFCDPQASP